MASVIDLFAGVGLVSTAFELEGHSVVLASDYSSMKEEIHNSNHPQSIFLLRDIRDLSPGVLPDCEILHGSFPCTDTSVAGYRKGCREGNESPMYWEFYRILEGLIECDKAPKVVTLENVEGLLTSNNGEDLREIVASLNSAGYFVDIALLNSFHFLPQSRSRLFIVGRMRRIGLGCDDLSFLPSDARPSKVFAYIKSHPLLKWDLVPHDQLSGKVDNLQDIIDLTDQDWWSSERVSKLLSQMFDRHLEIAVGWKHDSSCYHYGTVFRRMRRRDGLRQSTAELRSDGIAGCLRTPKGGSAKQILLRAGRGTISARHLNPVECARLMGADQFVFNKSISTNNYLYGFGDSVCVPVMRWVISQMVNPSMDCSAVAPVRQRQGVLEGLIDCAA